MKACWLQSNNGSEFVNKTMKQFCQLNDIIYKMTIPYFLEQNEIAEWAIAVFFEIVHYILWSTEVKLQYWRKTFMYAIYIRNITLTSSLKGVMLYKVWTGCKSDIHYALDSNFSFWTCLEICAQPNEPIICQSLFIEIVG